MFNLDRSASRLVVPEQLQKGFVMRTDTDCEKMAKRRARRLFWSGASVVLALFALMVMAIYASNLNWNSPELSLSAIVAVIAVVVTLPLAVSVVYRTFVTWRHPGDPDFNRKRDKKRKVVDGTEPEE